MTNEGLFAMIKRKCVFSEGCNVRTEFTEGCMYNVQDSLNTVLLSQIDCPVLQANLETLKERRIRHAQEKRAGH